MPIFALLLLLIAGCASSTATAVPEVTVQLEQLPDAGFAVEDRGAISVGYQLTVRNGLPDAITLRKIDLRTLARSPYTFRNPSAELSDTIPPGEERVVTFTMWAVDVGPRSPVRRTVFIDGVLHFDSARGSFRKPFTATFREP